MAKGIKPPKPKKCRICPEKFIPRNSLQTVCSPKCAIQLANQMSERKQKRLEKEQRTAWNKRKADVKPLSHWMNMTQRHSTTTSARGTGISASAVAAQQQLAITQGITGQLRRLRSYALTKTMFTASVQPATCITPAQLVLTASTSSPKSAYSVFWRSNQTTNLTDTPEKNWTPLERVIGLCCVN